MTLFVSFVLRCKSKFASGNHCLAGPGVPWCCRMRSGPRRKLSFPMALWIVIWALTVPIVSPTAQDADTFDLRGIKLSMSKAEANAVLVDIFGNDQVTEQAVASYYEVASDYLEMREDGAALVGIQPAEACSVDVPPVIEFCLSLTASFPAAMPDRVGSIQLIQLYEVPVAAEKVLSALKKKFGAPRIKKNVYQRHTGQSRVVHVWGNRVGKSYDGLPIDHNEFRGKVLFLDISVSKSGLTREIYLVLADNELHRKNRAATRKAAQRAYQARQKAVQKQKRERLKF